MVQRDRRLNQFLGVFPAWKDVMTALERFFATIDPSPNQKMASKEVLYKEAVFETICKGQLSKVSINFEKMLI